VWLLNSALRSVLLRRGVRHDRDHDRYYFLPDHETVTRRVEAKTKTGRNQSAKKVVRQEGGVRITRARCGGIWPHNFGSSSSSRDCGASPSGRSST
jgi:hypothetical protein